MLSPHGAWVTKARSTQAVSLFRYHPTLTTPLVVGRVQLVPAAEASLVQCEHGALTTQFRVQSESTLPATRLVGRHLGNDAWNTAATPIHPAGNFSVPTLWTQIKKPVSKYVSTNIGTVPMSSILITFVRQI